MILALQVLGGLTGLLLAGFLWQAWSEARRPPAPGRMVDIGGRRLHLRLKGEAPGPTVVIEQGAGAPGYFWWSLQDEAARFARTLTYDRAGYGWSDPARAPRSIRARAEDLHALLKAAAVPGPYLLVGHSYGGPVISLFARDYPDEVAGLVFADTPDMEHMLGPAYQQATRKVHMPFMKAIRFVTRFGLLRLWATLFPTRTLTSGLAPEPRAAAAATRRTSASDAAIDDLRSLWSVPQADRQPLAPGALGAKPVGVISHGIPFPGPFAALEEGFPESQARLMALSSNALHVTLEKANHVVQIDDPEGVLEVIRQVHAAARDGTRLTAAAAAA